MSAGIVHSTNFVGDAVGLILDDARLAIEQRGAFRIALAGGNTPRQIYAELARRGAGFDWEKVIVTFGDERCVPPEDDLSNYKMAADSLLRIVPIPAANVHRMKAELPAVLAADEYETVLAKLARETRESIYLHDLILLGLGADGHTASLFPGTSALDESTRMVVANHVPQLAADRITLTFPAINAARHVCFLVADREKEPVWSDVVNGAVRFPASRVQPSSGRLTWLLGF